MAENKNEIHIGDGVADAVKSTINTESAVILTELIKTISDYLKSKLKDIPETIENLLNSPESKQEAAALWSEHLFRGWKEISGVSKGIKIYTEINSI